MYAFLMFFKVFSVRYLLAWANFVSFVRMSIPWSAFGEAAIWKNVRLSPKEPYLVLPPLL